jgi:hypothetical protein
MNSVLFTASDEQFVFEKAELLLSKHQNKGMKAKNSHI